ncbi:MAG: NUDIX hydrolase [Nitrososphaerales archaeon]
MQEQQVASRYMVDGKPEMIYTVDELGNLLTLETRESLHLTRSSKRHAAVIGMIVRRDGKFVVQWRAKNKLGGNRLDVSATTHVRRGETYESALQRSVENELGVKVRVPLWHVFDFTYTEDLGVHMENEYCKVFFGSYDGMFEPNPQEIDSIDFLDLEELTSFVNDNVGKATKWLRETVKRMKTPMLERP